MSEQNHIAEAVDRVAARHVVAALRRTAGEVRFIKDRGGDDKDWGWTPPGASERSIDPDYKFDARNLKPLAQTLRSALMALGHIQTARTTFTKIRSQTISPDGSLGGKGYILTIKDIRKLLSNCDEALSSITDAIYDEMQAIHWHPAVGDSGGNPRERGEVKQIMDDVDEIRDNPEDWAQGEEQEMDAEGGDPKTARGKVAYGRDDPCPDETLREAALTLRKAAYPLMKVLQNGFRERGWTVYADEMTEYLRNPRYGFDELRYVNFRVEGLAGQKIRQGNREVVLDRNVSLVVDGEFKIGTAFVDVDRWESPSGNAHDPATREWTESVECPSGEPERLTVYWGSAQTVYPATAPGMHTLLGDFDKHWPVLAKVRSRVRRRHAGQQFEDAVARVADRWVAGRAQ